MRVLVLLLAVGAHAAVPDRYHAERAPGAAAVTSRASARERTPEYWAAEAAAGIEESERRLHNLNKARNVVMFLGDGMSVPTLAAARALLGQRHQQPGEEAQLSFEAFPSTGFSKTYCLDQQVADSACSATAYLCGAKANYGTIGVSGDVPRHDCAASTVPGAHLDSIAAWALQDGRDAGVVTTTRVTHASPAGVYARVANRDWENDAAVRNASLDPAVCPDIAEQLINHAPGNQFKVILGGGRREFRPIGFVDEESGTGLRADNRDLIQEWQANKQAEGVTYNYVWNREQLMELASSPPEYLLGLFENTHLQYHMEANSTTEPTLAELTEIAIKSLSRNENGFFLFVESGRIDHAHHDNYARMALDETIAMSDAVERATQLLSEEDSLIVVTADHAHVMAYNGYSARGNDILGPNGYLDGDGVPYMTLSYTNGPGIRRNPDIVRHNVLLEEGIEAPTWRSHVEIPLDSETHGGDDVAVFAWGPRHYVFSGLYEQSRIPHLMAYAACFGPGKHACENHAAVPHIPSLIIVLLAACQILRLY